MPNDTPYVFGNFCIQRSIVFRSENLKINVDFSGNNNILYLSKMFSKMFNA